MRQKLESEKNTFADRIWEDYIIFKDNMFVAYQPFESSFNGVIVKQNILMKKNLMMRFVNLTKKFYMILVKRKKHIFPLWMQYYTPPIRQYRY